MSAYLIRDVKVLDGTGRAPFAGSVLIEGDRIAAVTEGAGPSTAGEARPLQGAGEAAVIEGAGATLMPGLIESPAHLGLADLGSYDLTRVPPEEHISSRCATRAPCSTPATPARSRRDRPSHAWTWC